MKRYGMELCVRTSGSLDRVFVLGPALLPVDIESTAIILHNAIKHQRSLETTRVYWRLPWYYQGILGFTGDYQVLLEINIVYWRLPGITRVYWLLPGFIGDYQGLLEITRVYWRLPGFTGD